MTTMSAKRNNITVYCHPTDDNNIQIGGWRVAGEAPTVSVSGRSTNVSVSLEKDCIKIVAFQEDDIGNLHDVIKEVEIPYGKPCPEREDDKHILIKDFQKFSTRKTPSTPKHTQFFVSGEENKENAENPTSN